MHLNSKTTLNLIDGMTSEAERRLWDEHIRKCGKCAVKLKDWCMLLGWLKRSHLLNTPEDALALAKKIFPINDAKVRSDAPQSAKYKRSAPLPRRSFQVESRKTSRNR